MPLAVGTLLGPYEVLAPLGAGGMGEVYRARDPRLGRDVAIKVLPASVSADPEARARFEREARSVSQLNHPHICALYDVGRQRLTGAGRLAGPDEEIDFLVMEYLDGESLAARLERGPLQPDEALDYAMQIADALDKAHRHGIVHRDLKPANVMLTKGGAGRTGARVSASVAKLLDFGLAKLAPQPASGVMETVLAPGSQSVARASGHPATAEGTILGTFQYMAPEQVEAGAVDARADIWAFGCVLYEMLTGRRAFEAKTQASVIAGILGRDPTPVAELQPLAPPALARVVRICLAKDPDARYQSAYDLLLQLQWIAEGGSAAGLPAPVVAHRKRRERVLWFAVAALTLVAGASAAWLLKPPPAHTNLVGRFSYPLPAGQSFSRTGRRFVAVSPDGRRIAYIANRSIHVRELDQLESKPLTGTDEDPLDLVFSPDGQWLAYFVPEGSAISGSFILKKIQLIGGSPVNLARTGWPFGITWSGQTIAFGQNSDTVKGIQSVAESGGTPEILLSVSADEQVSLPQLLEDGRLVLYTVRKPGGSWDDARIAIQTAGKADRKVLVEGGRDARVVAGDKLLYLRAGTLFGIAIDVASRSTRGGPVPIVEGIRSTGTGAAVLALSETGVLAYVPETRETEADLRQLVWVDRKGREEIIPVPKQHYVHPRLSPDGSRIVAGVRSGESFALFTWDLGRQVMTRITPASESSLAPQWTPDGRNVIYRSTDDNGTGRIMRVDGAGASAPQILLELGAVDASTGYPESISHDGKTLFFRRTAPNAGIFSLDLVAGGPPTRVPLGVENNTHGMISPDSRSFAYTAFQLGGLSGSQIFIRPYPNLESDRRQVSMSGGTDPLWTRSGRELFFLTLENKLMSVSVEPGLVVGRVTEVFDGQAYAPNLNQGVDYDVGIDGRLLMIKLDKPTGTEAIPPSLTIVTHWLDELKARVK